MPRVFDIKNTFESKNIYSRLFKGWRNSRGLPAFQRESLHPRTRNNRRTFHIRGNMSDRKFRGLFEYSLLPLCFIRKRGEEKKIRSSVLECFFLKFSGALGLESNHFLKSVSHQRFGLACYQSRHVIIEYCVLHGCN